MKNITLIGNVGNTEVTKSEKGFYNLAFSIAVNSAIKDRNTGEISQKVDWFFCNKSYKEEPKKLMEFFKKGLHVCVIGEISFNTSTDATGKVFYNKNVYVDVLKILSSKKDSV